MQRNNTDMRYISIPLCYRNIEWISIEYKYILENAKIPVKELYECIYLEILSV